MKQCLDRNRDLLEVIWGDLQHLLHDLRLADAPTENGDVVGEPRDPHGKIMKDSPCLKQISENSENSFCSCLMLDSLRSLHTNSVGFDTCSQANCVVRWWREMSASLEVQPVV